jgi:mercuric ion transport protein
MNKKNYRLAGMGVLTAIGASLCCITPILALISGASGIASAFSWMEPFRPYLIGITILVLGFAWYQKLKPRTSEEIQCECEEDKKSPFLQTKMFLGIVTIFAFLMLAFPHYGQIFYPKTNKVVETHVKNTQEVKFDNSQTHGQSGHVCGPNGCQ